MDILTKTISAAENYVDKVSETVSDRFDSLTETAKTSVETTIEKTDTYLFDNFKNSITSAIDGWFAQHPFILWLWHHPLITLIGLTITTVLIIRLFVAIYILITTSIDRLWMWILSSPFLLLKALFGWEFKAKNAETKGTTTVTNYELTTNSQQLKEICDRLDLLQKQQQQIIQEIANLKQQEKHIQAEKFKFLPAIGNKKLFVK